MRGSREERGWQGYETPSGKSQIAQGFLRNTGTVPPPPSIRYWTTGLFEGGPYGIYGIRACNDVANERFTMHHISKCAVESLSIEVEESPIWL